MVEEIVGIDMYMHICFKYIHEYRDRRKTELDHWIRHPNSSQDK